MQLISYCEPRHVMLVHGEAHKMEFLKEKIRQVSHSWSYMYCICFLQISCKNALTDAQGGPTGFNTGNLNIPYAV